MSPSGLHQFLVQEQLMKDVDAKFAVDLIRRYEPSPSKDMGRMTLSGNFFFFPFRALRHITLAPIIAFLSKALLPL